MTETAKKKRGMPSSFTILLALLAIVAVITVIVSGTSGGEVTAARLSDFCTAPVKGFADALPVCLFVMILGGFLGMMTETGALDNGIAVLVQKLKGNEIMLVPVLMLIFSLGGTTYGMCEETVPFYALLAATMMAAGFDPMVGAATVLLGAGCGCLGSTVNPFAVGAAVDALTGVGIEVNQSIIIGLGAVLWIVTTGMSIFFVMNYAKKVKADKGSTILSMQELKDAEETHGKAASEVNKEVKLTGRQKGVLIAFAFTFVVMIVGFIPLADLNEGVANFFDAGAVYDADGNAIVQGWSALITGLPIGQWYFDEASTWFFLMAVLIGIIGGLSEKQIVNTFITGAADMMSVVLVIALARGISVLMASTGPRRLRPRRCRQCSGWPVRRDLRSHELPGLLRPVLPDPLDLWYGYRVHAHHGTAGCQARLLARGHGHDLLRRHRHREPVHPDFRRHHGRSCPGQDRVDDLAQVCS